MPAGRLFLLAALGLLALLGLLPWGAGLWPPDPALPNVAAREGQDAGLLHPLVALWALALLLAAFLAAPRGPAPLPGIGAPPGPGPGPARAWGERLLVAGGVVALFSPPGLARFGPHVEDAYFLASLWRMECGDLPHADFEFLYGPLMIAPLRLWMQATGFSMTAYYAFHALGQALFWGMLVAILQRRIPHPGRRALAFLLLLPFLLDVLLGLNWTAWRYFAAPLAILLLAAAPRSPARAAGAGAVVGLGLAFSWEYGIAALAAGLAMQALLLCAPGNGRGRAGVLLCMAVFAGTAGAVAAGAVLLATGGDPGPWLASLATVAEAAQRLGLGQFAFAWTLHALALFGLLALVLAAAGAGLRRLGQEPGPGDLELAGALAFLGIALRIALQRADHLHLAVPFVPLLLVLLAGRPLRLVPFPAAARTAALGLAAVAAIAHAMGQIPIGPLAATGAARGLLHALTGRPTAAATLPAGFRGTEAERSFAEPRVAALAARFAAPDLAGRPALFYGGTWALAMRAGICPAGYGFYDLLYSEAQAPLAATLGEVPGLLVVMRASEHDRLAAAAPPASPPPLQGLRAVLARTSSVHFRQSPLENAVEAEMWRRAVGDALMRDFAVKDRVADLVVLERVR